jgi:hypothetical protein
VGAKLLTVEEIENIVAVCDGRAYLPGEYRKDLAARIVAAQQVAAPRELVPLTDAEILAIASYSGFNRLGLPTLELCQAVAKAQREKVR